MVDFTINYQRGAFAVTYEDLRGTVENVNSQVMDLAIARWANTQDIGEFQRAFCQKPDPKEYPSLGYVAEFSASHVPPQADLVIAKIRAAVQQILHGINDVSVSCK